MRDLGKDLGGLLGKSLGWPGNSSLSSEMTIAANMFASTSWWSADSVETSGTTVNAWMDLISGVVLTPPVANPTRGLWWGEGRYGVAIDNTSTTQVLDNSSASIAGLLGVSRKSTILTLAEPLYWAGSDNGAIFAACGGTVNRFEVSHSPTGTQTTGYRTPGAVINILSAQGQKVRSFGYDGTTFRVYHGAALTNSVVAGANATLTRAVIGGSFQNSAYTSKFTGLIRHVIVIPGAHLPTEYPTLWARLVAALEAETTALRIIAGRGTSADRLSSNTITASESRIRCFTRTGSQGTRLVLPAYYLAPPVTRPSGTWTARAAIELGNTNYPATFRGASSRPMVGNDQLVTTDPIVDIPPNTTFYVRTSASCSLGQQIPVGFERINAAFAAYDQSVATNGGALQVGGVGAMSTTGSYFSTPAYAPVAILGVPIRPQPQCLIIGDSIVRSNDWNGDPNSNNIGWLQRGLFTGGRVPFISYDRGGSQLQHYQPATSPHPGILAQGSQSKVVVCLGRNSMSLGIDTLKLQVQDIVATFRAQNCEVHWCLTPPETTSTDAWATTANQTLVATSATRLLFHEYLRSQVGVTLAGIIDPLPYIESSTAANKWIPGYTADGIHPGTSGVGSDEPHTVHEKMVPAMHAVAASWCLRST